VNSIQIQPHIQAAYDEQYTQELTTWRELGGKYKAANIVELAKKLGAKKVLEVGAGEGSILKYLDEWGFAEELYAVEISRSGIDFIQKRNLPRVKSVQTFNGYELPYPDDGFDLVILSHVLEHVEFPRLLLREMRRIAPHTVIEIPCDFSLKVDQYVDHFLSYGHINIFVPTELRFLLKTEGYDILADKLGQQVKEVFAYNRFVNQKTPNTFFERMKVNYHVLRAQLAFQLASAERKQLHAQTYTVLCQRNAKPLNIL
jgi:ubiquinone/menaquinone biosynthesis C-methylase UbiE